MKILIIDDDPDIGTILTAYLKSNGHETDYVDNGHEGLPLALEGNFDLIILDRQLPGNIDGIRLLKILRAEDNGASVLILSGRSRVIDHIEGFRFGTDDYLAKPFTLKDLGTSISSIAAIRSSKRDVPRNAEPASERRNITPLLNYDRGTGENIWERIT